MATTYNKVTFNAATLLSLENDTVTAADLRTGVTAHDASGNAITGTLVPGGAAPNVYQDAEGYVVLDDEGSGSSPGLEYETGTFTPSTNYLTSPWNVSLHETHSKPPTDVIFVQSGQTQSSGPRVIQTFSLTAGLGTPQTGDGGTTIYGMATATYTKSDGTTAGTLAWRLDQSPADEWDGSSSYHPRYWATESKIKLVGSTNYPLSGTYNWVAIWR